MTFFDPLRARAGAGRDRRRGRAGAGGRIRPTSPSSRRILPAVQTMTANFIQTDAKGRSAAGTLQLKRPGRVRFQYGSGDLLLVADGKTLNFLDYQVGQNRAGRSTSTPLGLLLSGSPDFNGKRADPAEQGQPRSSSFARRDPRQYGHADARLPAQRVGARAGCSSTAGPRSTRRTSAPPSSCRTCATMSRCRTAPSPTPSRRSEALD